MQFKSEAVKLELRSYSLDALKTLFASSETIKTKEATTQHKIASTKVAKSVKMGELIFAIESLGFDASHPSSRGGRHSRTHTIIASLKTSEQATKVF